MIEINFASDKMLYRLKNGGGKNQPVAKAVSLKKIKKPYIVDATAGLGRDSFILASLGYKVQMIERNQIIGNALEKALNEALNNEEIKDIAQRISLHIGDSANWLENTSEEPDIIYIDPMFPKKTKSALVKKDMQDLQKIVGYDEDSQRLLQAALKKAKYKVVAKRPRHGEYIGNIKPSFSLDGKSNRFDVYGVGH